MARNSKRSRKPQPDVEQPTPEQMGAGEFRLEDTHDKLAGGRQITIGKAYRRRPMIDVLADQGLFSESEHKALKHYRHHADLAERSLIKDSLNKTISGGDGCPSKTLLYAIRVRDDCERAAQSLRDILRAIVVEDISLSQWAISRAGAIEDCVEKNGSRVCRLKPRQKALAIAKLEIQMAAKRVDAELRA